MKSVGVIGGLGPGTTAEFYLEVIFRCHKRNNKQRPLVVIANVPLDLDVEREFLAANKGAERYLPFLIKEAKRLEKSGVDFLVMPCNSLHMFINELRAAVKIPMLSIVEETIAHIKDQGYKKVGLVSTSATVLNKVYETVFEEQKIDFITPTDEQRGRMDQIIQRLVDNQLLDEDRALLEAVAKDLASQQADCVALACTDLQLLRPQSDDVVIFDTMKILADATVNKILS
jgi:aspartate racemase